VKFEVLSNGKIRVRKLNWVELVSNIFLFVLFITPNIALAWDLVNRHVPDNLVSLYLFIIFVHVLLVILLFKYFLEIGGIKLYDVYIIKGEEVKEDDC